MRCRGRAARLVISRDVSAAAVFGFGTPAIAIAPAALRTLSADEVEKIVLHEWAHVQRRDDVARLVLMVVQAAAGLHPAVWWIDRQLHIERETACDDWAINLTGSPRSYALCLTKLASLAGKPGDARLTPAALTASDLTRRVMRLLDARRSTATKRSFLLTATAMPLVFVVAAVLGRVELVATVLPVSLQAAPAASETARAVAETAAATPNPPPTPGARRPQFSRARSTAPAVSPQPSPSAPPSTAVADAPPPSAPVAIAEAGTPGALPGTSAPVGGIATAPPPSDAGTAPAASSAASRTPTPWGAAADASVDVGRGSQKAAVATAGFFSRLGKSIAGSF